ncbi:MAG: hypothetical protein HQL25_06535 [Candidatus Omnitrophica bacterium]|nr:hypothetical protein [Candidatus Omnitrophota bacterium]
MKKGKDGVGDLWILDNISYNPYIYRNLAQSIFVGHYAALAFGDAPLQRIHFEKVNGYFLLDATPRAISALLNFYLKENEMPSLSDVFSKGRLFYHDTRKSEKGDNFVLVGVITRNNRTDLIYANYPVKKDSYMLDVDRPKVSRTIIVNGQTNAVIEESEITLENAGEIVKGTAEKTIADALKPGAKEGVFLLYADMVKDRAMPTDAIANVTEEKKTDGGIDLNTTKFSVGLDKQGKGFEYDVDPAMLQQFINAPGVMYKITDIQTITNLPMFLGMATEENRAKQVAFKLSLLSAKDRKNLA